jgi:hypothetical protein
MYEDHDGQTFARDAQSWSALGPSEGGALVPPPQTPIARTTRFRSALVGMSLLLTVGIVAAFAWWTRSTTEPIGSAAQWDLQLASAGAQPVTALVFGREAGIHLVQLPAAGGSAELRRSIPVRLGQGSVYMVSLGRERLGISAASPPGAAPMQFVADGRFVKLLQTPEITGVRTGWW